MNDAGTLLVSGGTEKVGCALSFCSIFKAFTEAHFKLGPVIHCFSDISFLCCDVITFQSYLRARASVLDALDFPYMWLGLSLSA